MKATMKVTILCGCGLQMTRDVLPGDLDSVAKHRELSRAWCESHKGHTCTMTTSYAYDAEAADELRRQSLEMLNANATLPELLETQAARIRTATEN